MAYVLKQEYIVMFSRFLATASASMHARVLICFRLIHRSKDLAAVRPLRRVRSGVSDSAKALEEWFDLIVEQAMGCSIFQCRCRHVVSPCLA